MLKMEFGISRSGDIQFYPCFECDWCKKRIKQGQRGVFHYWYHVHTDSPVDTSLTVTHLGECATQYGQRAHQEKEGYRHNMEPLSELIGYLGSSLAMDWEPLIEKFGPVAYQKLAAKRRVPKEQK